MTFWAERASPALISSGNLPDLEALHAIEHPDCPWNGRTIFAQEATA
jgi:hypothetical protein